MLDLNTTTTRNANLADMAVLLQDQQARKVDMVVPASKIRSENATIVVEGAEPVLTADGVSLSDGRYQPTAVFDEGVSSKLNIPLAYVRRLREDRPDLYDANVNGWLEHDSRSFLLRAFGTNDGSTGIARAMLSDSYRFMDNLDALMAALDGIQQSGVNAEVTSCDLTERRMTVKVKAPELQVLAPTLLEGYRSPFTGAYGAENPVVFGGFVLSNSETGGGAFTVTPRLEVLVCNNGMTITKDALRAVHLGSKLEEGTIRWSQDTVEKTSALITAKTRDAVRTFLDIEYVERVIRSLEAKSGTPVEDAVATIQHVGKKLAYTEEQQKGILDHFIKGGQLTAGGIVHAVTSFSQTVEDADVAYDLEASAVKVLELV